MNQGAGLHSNQAYLIDFSDVKDDFEAWLRSRDLSSVYIHRLLRYLERFPCRIKGPMDVVRLFSDLTLGQKRNLQKALRTLLRFYEVQGLASDYWLDLLRKNIPKTRVGVDLRIPSKSDIVRS